MKAKDLKCIVMRQHVKQYHYICIKFKACQNNLTSRGCKIIIWTSSLVTYNRSQGCKIYCYAVACETISITSRGCKIIIWTSSLVTYNRSLGCKIYCYAAAWEDNINYSRGCKIIIWTSSLITYNRKGNILLNNNLKAKDVS